MGHTPHICPAFPSMLAHGRQRLDNENYSFINRVEAIAIYTDYEMDFVFICVFFVHFGFPTTLAVKLEKQAVGGCAVHVSDK